MDTAVFGALLYSQGRLGFVASADESSFRVVRFTHHHPKKRGDLSEALSPLLEGVKSEGLRPPVLGWSLEGARYRLFGAGEVGKSPAESLPALVKAEWPQINSELLLALPGTGGAYLVAAYKPDEVEETLASLAPLSLPSPSLVPLPFLAVRSVSAIEELAAQTTALVELHAESVNLFVVRRGEILGQKRLDGGLDRVFEAIQKKLELKFIGSAAKLVYDGVYDFSDNQDSLLAPLSELLASALAEMETIVGARISQVLPLNLGPETKWLEESIAQKLERSLVRFPAGKLPHFDEECAALGDTASLHPLLFALREPETLWSDLGLSAANPKGIEALSGLPGSSGAASSATAKPTPAVPAPPAEPSASTPPAAPEKPAETKTASPETPTPPPAAEAKTSGGPAKTEEANAPAPAKPTAPAPTPAAASNETSKSEDSPRTGGFAKKGKGGKHKNKGQRPNPPAPATAKTTPPADSKPISSKPEPVAAKPAVKESPKPIPAPVAATTKAEGEPKKKPVAIYAAVAAVVVLLLLFFVFSGGDDEVTPETPKVAATTTPPAQTDSPSPKAAPSTEAKEGAPSAAAKPTDPSAADPQNAVAAEAPDDGKEPTGETESQDLDTADTDTAIAPDPLVPVDAPEEIEPAVVITPTGGVLVQSMPEGAQVFLNDEPVGTTPLALSSVDVGAYDIRLELPDYLEETISLEVKEGEIAMPNSVVLTRLLSSVTITSTPSEVAFTLYQLEGEDRREIRTGITPMDIEDLDPTTYEVVFDRPGWESRSIPADLSRGGSRIDVTTTFRPGSLVVTSDPEGAEVRRGDMVLGTTPLTLEDLAPGDYVIEASIDSFIGEPQTATILEGEATELAFELVDYNRIFQPNEVEFLPAPATQIEPERLPSILREEKVVVRVLVDPEGVPTEPEVVSSTRNALNQLTIDTALQWRFEPAQYRGRPVRMRVTIPFVYNPIERF